MMFKIFAVASRLAMFCAFLWAARSPRRWVALRRSFLMEDGPVSPGDIWILRGLAALCIGCASWASVVSGHPMFALCFVPVALLLHLFIELMRRNVLRRWAGRYWTVRLSAAVAWAMAAAEWKEGERWVALTLSVVGIGIALWPAPVADFLADYAREETQVKWTRLSGIVGCVMSLAVIAALLLMTGGGSVAR